MTGDGLVGILNTVIRHQKHKLGRLAGDPECLSVTRRCWDGSSIHDVCVTMCSFSYTCYCVVDVRTVRCLRGHSEWRFIIKNTLCWHTLKLGRVAGLPPGWLIMVRARNRELKGWHLNS